MSEDCKKVWREVVRVDVTDIATTGSIVNASGDNDASLRAIRELRAVNSQYLAYMLTGDIKFETFHDEVAGTSSIVVYIRDSGEK